METDVVVIGGGPAGMAAAIESAKKGLHTILIERNSELGGILRQCIHNGFGLSYFKEELTGPEYAHRFVELVKKQKLITVLTNTFVTKIDGKKITIQNTYHYFGRPIKVPDSCIHGYKLVNCKSFYENYSTTDIELGEICERYLNFN